MPAVYLCVLYGSQNKDGFFRYAALADWIYNKEGVFAARYVLGLQTDPASSLKG
jgi:hypothetical protein